MYFRRWQLKNPQRVQDGLHLYNYPFMGYQEWKAKILTPFNQNLCQRGRICNKQFNGCTLRHDTQIIKCWNEEEYNFKKELRMILDQYNHLVTKETQTENDQKTLEYFSHVISSHSYKHKQTFKCDKVFNMPCEKLYEKYIKDIKKERKEQFLKQAKQTKNYLNKRVGFGRYKSRTLYWVEINHPEYINWLAWLADNDFPDRNFSAEFKKMLQESFTIEYTRLILQDRVMNA